MIRDEEIQRLINYIKGLGLKITFSSKKSDCSAAWYLDNSQIVVYKDENVTKIETILSLIHELGHAQHNIHEQNRKVDPVFERALDHVAAAELQETDSKKKQRKIILDSEIAGTFYWEAIYIETNMKFPIWRLKAAMERDVWAYQVFYETGSYPSGVESKQKNKELNAKYRKRHNG